jgi:hypothetical protein
VLLIPGSKRPSGDATRIISIFTNTWMATYSPQSTFCAFVRSTSSPLAVVLPDALTFDDISERYFGIFFFQAILSALHLNAARPGRSQPLLPAPSLPHFDTSSYNDYFVSDEPLDIADMGTTTAPYGHGCATSWLAHHWQISRRRPTARGQGITPS